MPTSVAIAFASSSLQAVGDLLHELGALLRGGLRPALERGARGGDRGVGVGLGGFGDRRPGLAGVGVGDLEGLRRRRGDPAAADVELLAFDHVVVLLSRRV
jgi:hypothetical protein